MTSVERDTLRTQLAETRTRLDQDAADRERLLVEAAVAGVSKVELATLSGLHRSTVYEILALAETRRAAEDKSATAQVEQMWMMGQVVEDRWGLRWRADWNIRSKENGWQCRSAGLKIWRSHALMAARGPLKTIRLDRVFAGPLGSPEQIANRVTRETGEQEDTAVTVNGSAAEDVDE